MKIFRSFDEAKVIRNPVVTTGSFDGVHIGHKVILNRLRMLADQHNGESVLITFDPHPRKVLYPDTAGRDLKLINSKEEKLELLEKAGLNNLIIIEFTREFSRITSEEFVRDLLCGKLHAKVVVVGFNHHFGYNKEGDYKQLWSWQDLYNFKAEEIPEQEVQHETVSSTKIRKAISEGYIQRANAYLDHYYIVKGFPVSTDASFNGSLPPMVRVPLTDECKLLPPEGIYAVSVESGMQRSKGMSVIIPGDDSKREVLLHVFDSIDLEESQGITIFFHKKIYGAVSIAESKGITRINLAKEEIFDLIY
jgi:riboflavin kinase/FMN adenylyltransferase